MTVYFDKARRRWRYHFLLQGVRHHGYCLDALGAPVASKSAAKQAEGVARRKAAIAPRLAQAGALALAQVVADLMPLWQRQAHWSNKKRYIRELLGFFGAETPVAAIDEGRIQDYAMWARTQPMRIWMGGPSRDPSAPANARYWKTLDRRRAPATINLYLGTLRQVLDRAAKIRDPVTGRLAIERAPHVPELAVPKRKARPIPDDVLSEILGLVPQHVAEAIVLTLYFGFRRGEVFGLEIANVDFEARGIRLFAENVKDAEDAFLPGGDDAMDYLARLVAQARARGLTRLIAWRRPRKDPAAQEREPWRPIARPKAAWKRAMRIVEKKFGRRFRWHDIRAAFITYVALTSGQLAAQTLARHSEYDTTKVYVEVADELRRTAAERLAQRPALVALGGKIRTQDLHTGKSAALASMLKVLK